MFVVKFVGLTSIDARLAWYLRESPEIVGRSLYTAAYKVLIPAWRQAIKDNHSIFRGELHQRVGAKVEITGDGQVDLYAGSLGVPYGLNVELGSDPRTVDLAEQRKLFEYCKKKLKMPPAQAFTHSLKIAASIETSGNVPHPFLMPVWNALNDQFLNDAISRMRARLGFV